MDETIRKFLQKTLFMRDIKCIFCGRELAKDSKYCTCDDCLKTLPYITGKVCKHCGYYDGEEIVAKKEEKK